MSFTLHVSAPTELPAPVAVCCHDAGAANLIAAWIGADDTSRYRVCAQGPAAAIFARTLPGVTLRDESEILTGAASLLSGTGWGGNIEHRARTLARQQGIPSFAVLDHWVNYRMRFERDGQQSLPDRLVVTDAAAREIAEAEFPGVPVCVWENRYLLNEVEQVRALTAPSAEREGRVLVVLEPIRNDWQPGALDPAEFRALDHLMDNLHGLAGPGEPRTLRLRPHPSEPADKYLPWLARRGDDRIALSSERSLAADIAWADTVAGLNSYALVVARAAGRRAVSYLPAGAGSCVLRYPGIEPLASSLKITK